MQTQVQNIVVDKISIAIHLHIGEAKQNKKVKTLIILPGFGSSASSGGTVDVIHWAKALGVPSIVVEFEGHGQSSGSKDDLTIGRSFEQLSAVINTIDNSIPHNGLVAFGSSFGGTIALLYQSKTSKFDAIFLRSPVVDYSAARKYEYGTKGIIEWKERGFIEIPSGSGVIKSTYEFYLDALEQDIYNAAERIVCPVMVCQGVNDSNVPFQQSIRLLCHLKGLRSLALYPKAGHSYKKGEAAKEYKKLLSEYLIRYASFMDE